MDGILSIFPLLLAGYGVYFLYQCIRSIAKKEPLDPKNFMPSDLTSKNCDDLERFTAFARPWVMMIGFSLILYAAASHIFRASSWFLYVVIGYFVTVAVVYFLVIRTARRRFWPDTVKEKKEKKK